MTYAYNIKHEDTYYSRWSDSNNLSGQTGTQHTSIHGNKIVQYLQYAIKGKILMVLQGSLHTVLFIAKHTHAFCYLLAHKTRYNFTAWKTWTHLSHHTSFPLRLATFPASQNVSAFGLYHYMYGFSLQWDACNSYDYTVDTSTSVIFISDVWPRLVTRHSQGSQSYSGTSNDFM